MAQVSDEQAKEVVKKGETGEDTHTRVVPPLVYPSSSEQRENISEKEVEKDVCKPDTYDPDQKVEALQGPSYSERDNRTCLAAPNDDCLASVGDTHQLNVAKMSATVHTRIGMADRFETSGKARKDLSKARTDETSKIGGSVHCSASILGSHPADEHLAELFPAGGEYTHRRNSPSVVLIGDFINDMNVAAYVAGISPLTTRTYSKLLSSDAPREDTLAADHLFVLLPRSTTCSTQHAGDVAARCRRLIVRLLMSQLESGRQAVCYGSAVSPVWSSEEFAQILKDPRLHDTRLRWCQLGAKDPVTGLGFRLVTRLLSTMELWAGDPAISAHCRCSDHATLDTVPQDGGKAARYLSLQWRVMHFSILSLAISSRPLRPEIREGTRPKWSKEKTEWSSDPKWSQQLAQTSGKSAQRSQEQFRRRIPEIVDIPQSVRQKLEQSAISDSHRPRPSAPVPPPITGSMGAVELDGRRHASDLPRADVAALHTRSFPTEQRNRQKAAKKAGHVAKKKPQVVEDHHDDCGEDFSPLGEDYLVQAYYEDLQHDQSGHSQYLQYSGEAFCLLDWYCGMNGCDYNPACLEEFCENGTPVVFENIEAFARWDTSTTHNRVGDDVAQLCGGAGDTAALLVKRGYKDGPNFDIIVGIDLMREDGRSYLRGYLRRRRPKIVLISMPCTGMKGFSALNRAINHAAWVRSRRVSLPLGKLAGKSHTSSCGLDCTSLPSTLKVRRCFSLRSGRCSRESHRW